MTAKRIRRDPQEWRHHLRAWETSGMTMTAYANLHGLNISSLGNARRRLRGRSATADTSRSPAFKRVVVPEVQSSAHTDYRLRLSDGLQLEFSSHSDFSRLAELLSVLRTLS